MCWCLGQTIAGPCRSVGVIPECVANNWSNLIRETCVLSPSQPSGLVCRALGPPLNIVHTAVERPTRRLQESTDSETLHPPQRRGRRDGSGAAEPRRSMRRGLQMSRSTNLFVCRKGKNPSTSNKSDAAVLAGTNAAVPAIGGAAGWGGHGLHRSRRPTVN